MAANSDYNYSHKFKNTEQNIRDAFQTYENKHGTLAEGQLVRLSKKEFEGLSASVIVKKLSDSTLQFYEVEHGKQSVLGRGTYKQVKRIHGFDKKTYALAKQMLKKDLPEGSEPKPMSETAIHAGTNLKNNPHIEAGEYFTWVSQTSGEESQALLMTYSPSSVKDILTELRKDFDNAALQLSEAVEAVHAEGMAHLDLKPANFLVGKDDNGNRHIKAADMDTLIKNRPIILDHLIGTLKYLPPEGGLGKRVANPQAIDIYELGVTLLVLKDDIFTLDSDSSKDDTTTALIRMMMDLNPNNRPTSKQVADFFRTPVDARELPKATPTFSERRPKAVKISTLTGLPPAPEYEKIISERQKQIRGPRRRMGGSN